MAWLNINAGLLRKIQRLADHFTYRGLPVDEHRRRGFLILLTLTSIILSLVSIGAGIGENGWRSANTLIPLCSILLGSCFLLALRFLREISFLFYLSIIYYGVALLYVLAIGADNGNTYVWLYVYPSITYFFLGTRGGQLIVFASWLISALIVWMNLGPYTYPTQIGLPFFMSYTLACVLAHGIEASRSRYYHQVQIEKLAVEEVLQQVKTLQDLLPICASCKNIRDDEGYWHQVESYIHEHAGVEFSHSICPDCRAKLYPSLGQRQQEPSDRNAPLSLN